MQIAEGELNRLRMGEAFRHFIDKLLTTELEVGRSKCTCDLFAILAFADYVYIADEGVERL